ncbi:uncharacterized protein N7483_002118 [Penicillium malachiteum]|uniref:uncharacterized protein n=1 Tax=Penicillium malachiteum TaxID=1324776 RepID=UPI00254775F0|nr:uncharacterized protein N7483_002118 [Penicillium malachiteum]KAJ5736993.1 hypothetical protein N7483_002118 [Penicillium malachiteum]
MEGETNYELSDIDRITVPMMVRAFLIYEVSSASDMERLVISINEGVQNATRQVPLMAGVVKYNECGKPYLVTPPGAQVECHVQRFENDEHKSFSKLASESFSPVDLDSTKFLPELPVDKKPVCALQLNAIEGGLILALTMLHTAGDWESMRAFLSLVCQGSQAYHQGHSMPIYTPDLNRSAYNGKNKAGISKHELAERCEGFYLMEPGSFIPKTPPPFRTVIYKISQSALADLKAQCTPLDVEYLSSYDCMSALLWVALTRARIQLHPEKTDSQSRLAHPIDLRSRDPKNLSSAQYFGNGVFPTLAGPINAQLLLSDDGLSIASSSIRKSINEINMDYIKDCTALVASLGPTDTLGYHADFHDMDILMNTWFSGSAQDFVIGDNLAPSTFRTQRPITGACFLVLPNVGGAKSNDREVLIQLEEREYEIMRRDEQFSKFFEVFPAKRGPHPKLGSP